MRPALIALGALVAAAGLLGAGALAYYRREPAVPPGAKRIVMTGRSTMGLWFKHWRWPLLLRWKTTYRSWPFPYSTHVAGSVGLFYRPLDGPGAGEIERWGEPMAASFDSVLAAEEFDAAFFKFCFVDFDLRAGQDAGERLAAMRRTVERVRESCARRGIPLVIGNALPLGRPTADVVDLQRRFNAWLDEFASGNNDVRVFDFFSRLAGPDGALKPELARSADDPHPNDRAFSALDDAFFAEVPPWVQARRGSGTGPEGVASRAASRSPAGPRPAPRS